MENIYTVSEITKHIKDLFDLDPALLSVTVKGEVSNCKYASSGHLYFTLKDKKAQINVVMWASSVKGLLFRVVNGDEITVTGSVSVYEPSGAYQLYARKITKAGVGELYERFLALKAELEEMGMFSEEYKKPIPKYINTLGVVTASTGAAIRDIIQISTRRNPYVQIVLYPAIVQGEAAAPSIIKGIKALEAYGPDVIIVGRGGGGVEDLWAFNERVVAQAIFDCSVPIISAVGHESDWTIADFVADMRAPTPSAAAELAVFEYNEFEKTLLDYEYRLKHLINGQISAYKQNLVPYEKAFFMMMERKLTDVRMKSREYETRLERKNPGVIIQGYYRRLSVLRNRIQNSSPAWSIAGARSAIRDKQLRLQKLSPEPVLERAQVNLDNKEKRLFEAMDKKIKEYQNKAVLCESRLKGLSPTDKLSQGYAFVQTRDGLPVKNAQSIKPGDEIQTFLHGGKIESKVTLVELQ